MAVDRPPRRAIRCPFLAFCLLAGIGAAALGALLGASVPTVQALEGWFWPLRESAPLGLALLAALAAAPLLLLAATASAGVTRLGLVARLLALIGLGAILQHGLAFIEGRGWEGMRDRALRTGHAEFALTASRVADAGALIPSYEALVQSKGQRFARSKPPGHLLFYVAADRVAQAVMPPLGERPGGGRPEIRDERHGRLVDFMTLFFPLCSLLALFPLAYLGAVFLGRERALWPSLLYVTAPPTALITLHLDQVLYPLLAAGVWALAVRAVRDRRLGIPWWLGTGAVAWLALFVSFSLLPALAIAVALALAAALQAGRRGRPLAVHLAAGAGLALGAFLLLTAAAYLWGDYDPWRAFERVMAHHAAWKTWREDLRLQAALLNLTEFSYWIGLPFVAALVAEMGAGAVALVRRQAAPWVLCGLGTILTVVLTAVLGNTWGEAARLWIFFLPAVALVVSWRLARWLPREEGRSLAMARALLGGVATLQLAWMACLKARQDFW